MATNPYGGSNEHEGRDSWCTPAWLALLIGHRRLDPCSNPRSLIQADHVVSLEMGGNGLLHEGEPGWYLHNDGVSCQADRDTETYINPPFAAGQVVRWVRHYRHTNFIYLLRWDPSTAWFKELLPFCAYVWFPTRRVNFEPPPGVTSSSNPFPHALYLREKPNDDLLASGWTLEVERGWNDLMLSGL